MTTNTTQAWQLEGNADTTSAALANSVFYGKNTAGTFGMNDIATEMNALGYITAASVSVNSQVGIGTRTGASGSGAQVIAHGLGVAPSAIKIRHSNGTTANGVTFVGIYDGTNQFCFGQAPFDVAGTIGLKNNKVVSVGQSSNGRDGVISATSATDFTITWTETGTATDIDFIREVVA